VTWTPSPDSSSTPFVICIVGKVNFGATLDSLIAKESIQGRKITTRRLSSINDAESCHIVFLAMSEESRLTKDLDALKDKPILTVSSLPGFLEHGGVIQFISQGNRVRFAVNLAAAAQSRIALSSELLKVALYVNPKRSEEAQ
jgi:hypothetical protein